LQNIIKIRLNEGVNLTETLYKTKLFDVNFSLHADKDRSSERGFTEFDNSKIQRICDNLARISESWYLKHRNNMNQDVGLALKLTQTYFLIPFHFKKDGYQNRVISDFPMYKDFYILIASLVSFRPTREIFLKKFGITNLKELEEAKKDWKIKKQLDEAFSYIKPFSSDKPYFLPESYTVFELDL
jgi:hypothetical protein